MQDSEFFFLTNESKTLSGIDELKCPAEVHVPSGVTKIDRRAFAACPAKKIFLPDSVTQIGYEAFYGCDALEYVRFPKKIESVEPAIFRECFSLRKVEFGDEISALSENMFECCYSLEEAPFRSGILELPRNVFSECISLESLVIPEGVAVIKSGAAAYCKNLSTLVLPSSIKIIEDDAFRNCTNLAHIRFSAENPVFFTDEDSSALFERHDDGTLSLIKVPVNARQIRIPKNVTHSHSEAFQGCDSIEKVFLDCAMVDHPLFVALKTEIVDAEFIDETEKEISPEAEIEKNEAEENSLRTDANLSEENPPKEKVDLEESAKDKIPSQKAKPKSKKVEKTETPEKKENSPKKPRKPREKKKKASFIEETLSAEPSEPKIEIELPASDTASAEIETEIAEAALTEECAVAENENADALEIETEITETTEQSDIEDEIVEEPQTEEIPESSSMEIENAEESLSEEIAGAENENAAAEQIGIEDEVADILEQNIASGETTEEEEDELRGITITIEELDEAMMRGIQEEEESDYKIPEGIFPTDNAEEEPEDLPPPEPRFVNGMISVSGAFEVVDERTLYPDRAEEDLCTLAPNEMEDITTLVVVTEFLDDDGKISESAKDFCVALAKKYDLKRVYFFGALSLDNDEFLYGFGKFALYRNVIFVPNAPNFDSLSSEVKSFAEIAELDTANFQNLKNTDLPELELPFKIFACENSQSRENEIPAEEIASEKIVNDEIVLEENGQAEIVDAESECAAYGQISDAPMAEENPVSTQEEVASQTEEEPQDKISVTGKGLLARAQEKDFAALQGRGLLAKAQSALKKRG